MTSSDVSPTPRPPSTRRSTPTKQARCGPCARCRGSDRQRALTRRRLLASVAAVGVVAAGAAAVPVVRRLQGDGEASGGDAPATTDATTTTAAPTTTAAATTTTAPATHLEQPLGRGSSGSDVAAVQQRLTDLSFAPGVIDGKFGTQTEAAVWAFEKLVLQIPRDDATGVVDDALWQVMQEPIDIQPRRPNAGTTNHTEVYLPEQVVAFFTADRPALVTHMSSGNGQEWRQVVTIDVGEFGNEHGSAPIVRGEIGYSDTPGGIFSFDRFVQGRRESALGGMYNPAYFNYGIAIHGAHEVPLHPASHGCIRIPMAISETFQQLLSLGDEVYVWDGQKEPEVYGWDNPPRFNRVDPDWVPPPTAATVPPTTTTLV